MGQKDSSFFRKRNFRWTLAFVIIAAMMVQMISGAYALTAQNNDLLGYNFPDHGAHLSDLISLIDSLKALPQDYVILMDSQGYNVVHICEAGPQCVISEEWNYFFQYLQFASNHKVVDFTNDTSLLRTELAGYSTIVWIQTPPYSTLAHYPWLASTLENLHSGYQVVNATYSYNATSPAESFTTTPLAYFNESTLSLEVHNYNDTEVYFNLFGSQDGANYSNFIGPQPFDGSQNPEIGPGQAETYPTISLGGASLQYLRFALFNCACTTPAIGGFFVSMTIQATEFATQFPYHSSYFRQVIEVDFPTNDFLAAMPE